MAHTLAEYGEPFTWNDTDAPQTAWKASTGAIYPADSTKFGPDHECWLVWKAWYDQGRFHRDHLEKNVFCFSTKKPPHGGKYGFEPILADNPEGIKRGERESYHFNAQQFVLDTRKRFLDRRTDIAPKDRRKTIITHGFGERMSHAYWGWTRLVELEYPDVFGELRPSFYFREGRFVMAYAYPVPGTKWWYAGSSIIKQKAGSLKSLEIEPKYEKWKLNFERLAGGNVRVVGEGEMFEGWRPAASAEDPKIMRVRKGNISLRPHWNSGIRHFPEHWEALAPVLGLVP